MVWHTIEDVENIWEFFHFGFDAFLKLKCFENSPKERKSPTINHMFQIITIITFVVFLARVQVNLQILNKICRNVKGFSNALY